MTLREFVLALTKAYGAFTSGFHSSLLATQMLFSNFAYCASAQPRGITVALVTGGAVLGFDGQVHIDLDCAHAVLSPDKARRFAAELKKIADTIDPLPDKR